MGNTQAIKETPLQIAFSHGFLYIETDKSVYYPGEILKGTVHLLLNEPLGPDNNLPCLRLDLKLRGKESFKFLSPKRNDTSCSNSYIIFDSQKALVHFQHYSVAIG